MNRTSSKFLDLSIALLIMGLPFYFWILDPTEMVASLFYWMGLSLLLDGVSELISGRGLFQLFFGKMEPSSVRQRLALFLTAISLISGGTLIDRYDEQPFMETEETDLIVMVGQPVSVHTKSFPQAPKHQKKILHLPGGSKSGLQYDEYVCKHPRHEIHYSLSAVKLPKDWLRWSSSLILKGSVKVLVQSTPGMVLLESHKGKHGNYPCIDYLTKHQGNEYRCRIMLADDTLYKLELHYAPELRETALAEAEQFFTSFSPNKS